MHAVAAIFASIITFMSGFFAPTVASNSPVDVRTTQPAAVVAAQTVIAGNPFNDAAAASAVAAAIPATVPASAFSPPPAPTVINQPVIERIIERIVPQGGTISADTLSAILADFEQSISSRIAALSPPKAAIPEQVAAAGNSSSYYFAPASQRIDQITNTAINTPTITGGSISGASVSGYLPLSGGTLTGALSGTDLNLSGNLTAGTLSVAGLSSGGALFAPYFSATSTTATSTFAGGFTAANGSFSILQNGNVGMGTAAPSIAGVNSNSRVLSIVGDGTLVNARGVLELANPRASGSLAANDTAGSAFFVMSNNSGSPYIAGVLGSLSGSGGANGFGGKLQFQTKADNNASSATTKMALDQNGNVGIGTTTPWGKLSITGSGTGTGLAFAIADSANTPHFVIQDNGNVGIGTTTPLDTLGVNGSLGLNTVSSNALVNVRGAGSSATLQFDFPDLSATGNAVVRLFRNTTTTGDLAFKIYKGDNTSAVQTWLAASAGNSYINALGGSVGIGTTTPWGKLSVQATDNSSAPQLVVASSTATSLFVGANGKVGIGTTSPAKLLDIYGAAAGLSIDASSGNPSVIFKRNSATDATIATAQAAGQVIAGSATGDLAIRSESHSILFSTNSGTTAHVAIGTNGNVGIGTTTPWGKLSITGSGTGTGLAFAVADSANTPRFVIQDNGNVGIGTTIPSYSLDVNGFINADGMTGGYNLGGNTVLYASTTNSSLAVGASGAAAWMRASSTLWNSVAIGPGALATTPVNGTTQHNTAVGVNTLYANTTGYANVALGHTALQSNTSGTENTGIGVNALFANTTGGANIAIGMHSLMTSTNGYFNTVVGAGAMQYLTGADLNSAFGLYALRNSLTGAQNTALGANSQINNTTGSYNTASGINSLLSNTTGNTNVASGYWSSYYNGSATNTVAIGANAARGAAAYSNQGGTVVGFQAGYNFATGSDYNALFGVNAGYGVTTGSRNILIGPSTIAASYNQVTTGSNNIAIGNDVAVASPTASNQLVIGNLIYGTGLNGTGSTVSTGSLGIGTSTPTAQLHTTGTVRFSNFGAGTLTTDASGNLSVSSDERLKNIDGGFTRGLADVVKLSPIQYHWNAASGLDTTTQYAGFSAQNVQTAIPEAVGSSTSGYLTLQDRPLIAALVNATKEIGTIAGAFKSSLTAWLGSASNGIGDLFAKDIYATNATFNRVTAQALCAEDICVTRDQLAAVLAAIGQSTGSPSANASAAYAQAPVIELNGNASSTIEIGDTYNDLGARIIAPDIDLNLGIVILLDGATTTAVSIDTSAPGKHAILYTVTSPTSGLTGRAMRTLIVSPAELSPAPANDNASSTPAAASI